MTPLSGHAVLLTGTVPLQVAGGRLASAAFGRASAPLASAAARDDASVIGGGLPS